MKGSELKTIIRNYVDADREECMEAFKSNVPDFFTQQEIPDFEHFLIRIEKGKDLARFYVVLYDHKIIGCGGFGDKDNRGIVSLAWGLIHRNFHKKGFGKALLLYRLEKIKKHHPDFPIVVDTTQHSEGFFKKYGFQTVKITEHYYETGMHRYDMQLGR